MTEKVIVYRSMVEQARDEALFEIVLPFMFDHMWWIVGFIVAIAVFVKVENVRRDRRISRNRRRLGW